MSAERITTASTGVTHEIDAAGRIVSCSEAVDFLHYEDGGDPALTGYGFCEHYDNTVIGDGIVWIGYPPVDNDHAK